MSLLLAVLVAATPMIWEPSDGFHFRAEAPRVTTGWLGLYCNGTCALRPATLEYRVDPQFDDLLYTATRPAGARFVFRDVLLEGPVTSLDFEPAFPIALALNGEAYELRVSADGAVLTLHHRERSQVLYRMPEFTDEPHMTVLFAGDLDRDGKLDLIANLSWKYSLHPLQLFLSSAAGEGELVREVARFERSSC